MGGVFMGKKRKEELVTAALVVILVAVMVVIAQRFDAEEQQHRKQDEANFLKVSDFVQQRGLEIAAEYAQKGGRP
jgi:hypothetical protein